MNIIVIVCDTLRRDFLGYYGNDRFWSAQNPSGGHLAPTKMRTPHIDRLASESLIFDNAFIGSFPTIPLRAELLTGKHVFHTTGWAPLEPGQATLQSYLQEQGYVTAMITDNVQYLNPGMNYHVGFDACQWIRGHQADRWRTYHKPIEFPCDPSKLRQPEMLVVPHLRNNRNRTHEREWHDPQTVPGGDRLAGRELSPGAFPALSGPLSESTSRGTRHSITWICTIRAMKAKR